MKNRDSSIDFLRAIAIILMTITHVNVVLYSGNNPLLEILTTVGSTLCFSMFLFASSYVTGLKMEKRNKISLKETFNRIFEIYVIYIILGIIITYILEKGIGFDQIYNIAFLSYVPKFTEFLIAFIIFSLFSLFFFKQLKSLLKKPYLLVIISIIIFIFGYIAYTVISKNTYPEAIKILFENIFGYKLLHRFPFTLYFPIYTFGLLMSKYSNNRNLVKIILFSILFFVVLLTFKLSKWYRWPPSPLFHLYSFMFIPFVLLIYRNFETIFSKKVFTIISNIGKYPLEQFFLSTLFVFLSRIFFQPSEFVFLPIFINILIICLLLLHPIVFHREMV